MKKAFDVKIDDFVYFMERDEPPFPASMIAGGFSDLKNTQDYYGINQEVSLIFKNKNVFAMQSQVDNFVKQFDNKIKDKKYLKIIKEANIKAGEDLLLYSQKFVCAYDKLNNNDLAILLEEYYIKNKRYCGYYTIVLFQKTLTDLARDLANKYNSVDYTADIIFDLITSPSELTSAEQEFDNFLQLCVDYQMDNNISQKIAGHVKKYSWLALRYFKGNPWTAEDILDRVKKYSKDAKEELSERMLHRNQRQKQLNELLDIFKDQDKVLAGQIRDIVFLRTKRAEFVDESSAKALYLVEEIASRLDFTREEIIHCFPQEIIKKLKGDNIDLADIIKQRQRAYILFFPPQGASFALVGDDMNEYVNKHSILQDKIIDRQQKLSGMVAFRGKVSGEVKIVKTTKDLKKVKNGDVLVSVMTFPNFIVAMEKAAAFITDEGGILCHAAIVSREMKKPCVIGTKIATKILKDGDMVEVDANKGIVRKI